MRNGFKSSRGAMRGTIGGAPICLSGPVGFTTVAIGFGPFLYASSLDFFDRLTFKIKIFSTTRGPKLFSPLAASGEKSFGPLVVEKILILNVKRSKKSRLDA